MTVFSLRTDQCLDEGTRYQAEHLSDDPNDDRVQVFFPIPATEGRCADVGRCIRRLDVDVMTTWQPRLAHDPWDFSA